MTVAEPVVTSRAELTTTGLALPADLAYEEWHELGDRLFDAERAVMWWIGDWWRYGEHRYGEMAAQALNGHYSYGTFRNAAWVARQIEVSRRRDSLKFAHHQEVAALPPDEQDYWLEQAEGGEWSHKELRAAIKRGRAPDGDQEVAIEYSTAAWVDLAGLMKSLETLLSRGAPELVATVPSRRRATTAKRLRKLGTGLGRIAWSLEGMEGTDGRPV